MPRMRLCNPGCKATHFHGLCAFSGSKCEQVEMYCAVERIDHCKLRGSGPHCFVRLTASSQGAQSLLGWLRRPFDSQSYMTVNFTRIVRFPSILSVDVLHIPWISRKFHWQRSQGRTKKHRMQGFLSPKHSRKENCRAKLAVIMSRKARSGFL